MLDYPSKNIETKMKLLSAAMELYLIIWIITPAFGIYNECNKSLGLHDLDIDRIHIYTDNKQATEARGNIRLSENRPLFMFAFHEPPLIMIDLGEVSDITGMIIKGEDENTGELRLFSVMYGNSSDIGRLINYKNEKGEYVSFEGTRKEENIRYQPFYPSFVAKYFGFYLHPEFSSSLRYYLPMQIDVLGCRPPCNDTLNTAPGNVIHEIREDCFNNHHLEIKFEENGIYQIKMVKITILDDNVYKDIVGTEDYIIYYSYDLKKENKSNDFDRSGRSGIFHRFSTPVQSLKLCMYSDFFEGDLKNIYDYIIIEVKGCLIGTSSQSTISIPYRTPPPSNCSWEAKTPSHDLNITSSSGILTFQYFTIKWEAVLRNEYEFMEICPKGFQFFITKIDTTGSNIIYYALIYTTDGKKWKKFPKLIKTNQIHHFEEMLSAKCIKIFPISYIGNIVLQTKIFACFPDGCTLSDRQCVEYCPENLMCNGTSCVNPSDCPCMINNTKYQPGERILKNCIIYECIDDELEKVDEISCAHLNCSLNKEPKMDMVTCNCTCECKNNTIPCPKKDICGKLCDKIKDCDDGRDEQCCTPKPPVRQNCTIKKDVCEEKNYTKCSFREKKVIMFSKNVYACTTCNGYLIKDISENAFHVAFVRNCLANGINCRHFTNVKHDDLLYQIGPTLVVHLKNTDKPTNMEISPSNSVIDKEKGYEILMVADTIQFISTKYGFTVTWKINNIVDIEVSSCLLDQIWGLCGYYTSDKLANENITESGSCKIDPCEAWIHKTHVCGEVRPYKIKMKLFDIAQKSCNNISKLISDECINLDTNKTYESIHLINNACPDTIYGNCLSTSECKCEALKYFYESRFCDHKSEIKLFQKYKCDACPNGLEWNSCGFNETCETIKIKSEKNTQRRVPGCFCPEGLVNIDKQCRPPTECTGP